MTCDWLETEVIQIVNKSIVLDFSIHNGYLMSTDRYLPEARREAQGKAFRICRRQHRPH